MTADIINFPVRPLEGLEIFCTLPSSVKDLAVIDGVLFAICEDGSYLIDENGEYEYIRPEINP